MIKGMHVIFFNPQADEMRSFIRDKLGFPSSDAGDGWLIFQVPEADLACHPMDQSFQATSFYCDDIHSTVADLRARGVVFISDIHEVEYGFSTTFRMPGDVDVELYQPNYEK